MCWFGKSLISTTQESQNNLACHRRCFAVRKLSTGLNEVSFEYLQFEGPRLLEACFLETALSLLHFEACDDEGDFGPGLKSSAHLAALSTGGMSKANGSRGWELEAACM